MKQDKETLEVLKLGEKYHNLTKSEDWAFAKALLHDKIKVLDSISTLPDELTAEQKLRELEIRKGAIELITGWIKEIEDSAELHIENQSFAQTTVEETVIRFN